MRRDIVTYDSNFAEKEKLDEMIPDILRELRKKTEKIKKQMGTIGPLNL